MFWLKKNKKIILGGFIVAMVLIFSIIILSENTSLARLFAETNYCANESCEASVVYAASKDYSLKNQKKLLKITAGAYLIGDLDTGEIILGKDINTRYPIASVSKLVTALVTVEMIQNKKVIDDALAKTQKIYGTIPIKKKTITLQESAKDFLYPLLLRSSNQVAEILANEVGWPNFIRQMNEKASLIGMDNTLFEDPSGLTPHNISTTHDLFQLAQYLYKKRPEILEITKTERQATLGTVWSNNSKFLGNKGYLGGKTGFTNAAKQTLVSMFSIPLSNKERRNIAIIMLQSPDRFNDVQKILTYMKENVVYKKKIFNIPPPSISTSTPKTATTTKI